MSRPRLSRHICPFNPAFLGQSPLFWPIAPAAARLLAGGLAEERPSASPFPPFPPVAWFDRVFDGSPDRLAPAPVRFVEAAPPPRRRGRRRDPIDPRALYDARITLDRVVPTRAASWHDLMNALVWGTFPRAKRALHARQHRAIGARLLPGARTLPPTRTRELDALALLDEGGVVFPAGEQGPVVVFGHAIYESLALGVPPAVVAAIELDPRVGPREPGSSLLGAVDEALARVIDDTARLGSPEELRRFDLGPHAHARLQGDSGG